MTQDAGQLPACRPALKDLPGNGRIVVAFSGGPDSVCLAALLTDAGLDRSIECIHVDHGLDPDSSGRARMAAELADRLNLDCRVITARVQRKHGIEAGARKARYAILADQLQPGDVLVTAHHADDQAETVLMRLIRGSGPAGLAGIPRVRRFSTGWLARPLLDWTRRDILTWLEAREMKWVEDPANQDPDMDRNYIRQNIMPAILARWPGAVDSIRRSARLSHGASRVLSETSVGDLTRFGASKQRLQRAAIEWLDEFRCAELLRHWCHHRGHTSPPASRLEEFIDQARTAADDRQPEIRWDESVLRAHDQYLWLEKVDQVASDWAEHWSGQSPLTLPGRLGTLQIDPVTDQLDLEVCLGRPGERIRVAGHSDAVSVRKLMQRAGVPPWHRDLWPRLWRDECLVAVGNRWLDVDFATQLERAGATLSWDTELFLPAVESGS